ncbi:MAG: lipid-A-disaccharide synthase N-terminal domain-containing protein [Xanthomonadaceae bacterium]|nr:lipid-A-disaccharide synthase N-terminal domain-containing protein [Xanthomonadaceae bacterium]
MNNGFWIALGLTGQAVFCGRFLLQWLYSERLRRSTIPMGFWYASIAGSVLLLGFAFYKHDPVFITGYFGGLLIYLRNLHLRLREAKASRAGRPD